MQFATIALFFASAMAAAVPQDPFDPSNYIKGTCSTNGVCTLYNNAGTKSCDPTAQCTANGNACTFDKRNDPANGNPYATGKANCT